MINGENKRENLSVVRLTVRHYTKLMNENYSSANDHRYNTIRCRTLPIISSMTSVQGYPAKLKIYLTNASRYWQVRCFFKGCVRTKSTRTENKRIAINFAKHFYEKLVGEYYSNTSKLIEKSVSLNSFEVIAERSILIQYDRVLRKEISEATYKNNVYRLRQHWIPQFTKRDISEITHYDISKIVSQLSHKNFSAISISQYLQCLRNVFTLALAEKIIDHIPEFPKIKKQSQPRGGFSLMEYRQLVSTARKMTIVRNVPQQPTGRNRAGGIYKKTEGVPKEFAWLMRFMVNSFVRPSDIIQIQHKHIEIISAETIYLRLTLPETKRHTSQIVTLRPAVLIYKKLYAYMNEIGLARQEDYLFLPEVRNRSKAGWILNQHFQKILAKTNLKIGTLGQHRTLYSFRHTAIMFRLLYGEGIDLLTLAKNARTSVQMIEKFYASNLTAEMNINLLQSKRTSKQVVLRDK